MKREFVYGMRLRPPAPGAIPKADLNEVSFDEITTPDRHYWGTATYDRELTDEEVSEYEMDLLYEHRIY